MGLLVMTGSRYLGAFIKNGAAEKRWLAGKVEGWAESVGNLGGVACKHLQSAYSRLQKSLQQEWSFVQWVTPGIVYAFGPAEKALRETFCRISSPDWERGHQGEGSPACQ